MTFAWPATGEAPYGAKAKAYIDGRIQEVIDSIANVAPGTGDMLKSQNLAGLADFVQARANLGVYSVAQVDTAVHNFDTSDHAKATFAFDPFSGKMILDVTNIGTGGGTGWAATADTLPYFDSGPTPALLGFPLAGKTLAAGNVWRAQPNVHLRAALARTRTAPAKIALITDSEGEVGAFSNFARDIKARYPGVRVSVLHDYGGFNAGYALSGVLSPPQWATTGTMIDGNIAPHVGEGRGITGRFAQLTTGQTLTLDGWGDRIRVHYIQNTGTFNVVIDGVTVATSVSTATGNSWTSAEITQGPHTIRVVGASGTVKIDGAFHYSGNSSAGVQVHVLAHQGFTTADMVALSGGPATGSIGTSVTDLQNYLVQEAFDAVVFETAINDGSVAAWQVSMDDLLTRTRASLPIATLCLFLPEPGFAHAGLAAYPAVAQFLATSHGALLADMNTIAPDHSIAGSYNATTHVDTNGLTYDGIHYDTAGDLLASQLLLDVLDPAAPADAWSYFKSGADAGYAAPVFVGGALNALGWGVWDAFTSASPSVFVGFIRGAFSYGLFADDLAHTTFGYDTAFCRLSPGVWHTLGGTIKTKWYYDGADSGRVGSYYRDDGVSPATTGILGVGIYGVNTDTKPMAMVGYIRSPFFLSGLFAGAPNSDFDTSFVRDGVNGGWATSGRIGGLPVTTPAFRGDAVSRAYLDTMMRPPVRFMERLALPACTYTNGTLGVGAKLTGTANGALSMDSNPVALNDRVAVGGQAAASQNGIYIVTRTGAAGATFELTRSTAFDEAAELATGLMFTVGLEGAINAGTTWIVSCPAVVTMGTTAITFVQPYAGGQISFGLNFTLPYIGFAPSAGAANDATLTRINVGRVKFGATIGVGFDGPLRLDELVSTPSNPASSTGMVVYHKADKLVIAFNRGGTMHYYWLDATVDTTTWTHSTTAP